jgi:flagellar protein FlgJ
MSAAPVAISAAAPPLANAAANTAAIAPARLAQIKKTAQQFEAIFVRQMLSEAHKSSFGETMTDSKGADTFTDMQDARFADIASQKGAFGLGAMIEKQLIHRENQGTGNAAVPSPPRSAAPGTGR